MRVLKHKVILSIVSIISVVLLFACFSNPLLEIHFESNGGTEIPSLTVSKTDDISMPNVPERTGFTFSGWFIDNESFNNEFQPNLVEENSNNKVITLYAKWSRNSYFIRINCDCDSPIDPLEITFDSQVQLPTPIKEGHAFVSWDKEVPLYMPAMDLQFNAVWKVNSYSISFDTGGGSLIDPVNLPYNSPINIQIPYRVGYTFIGWDPTIPTRMPAQNLLLKANWSLVYYRISYELNGGVNNPNNPTTYNYNTTIFFYQPTKSGYTFDGWFDSSSFGGESIETIEVGKIGNLIVFAKWSPINYQIDYVMLSTSTDSNIPLEPGEGVILSSSHWTHSGVLTNKGNLFMWGSNLNGQIGYGQLLSPKKPINITEYFDLKEGERIVSIDLGGAHSAALTSQGRLFMWGRNSTKQVDGVGGDDQYLPRDITSSFNISDNDRIIQISLGFNHSSVLTSQGRVFLWGSNSYGQVGNGQTTTASIFELTNQFILDIDDKIIQLKLGRYFSTALSSKGRVFTWGRNNLGQLGDGSTNNRNLPVEITNKFNIEESDKIIKVSPGSQHNAALSLSGKVYTWGANGIGQLGNNSTINRNTPVEITHQFNLFDIESITNIIGGGDSSSAITSVGRVFIWGRNSEGQLGIGVDDLCSEIPVEIGSKFDLRTNEKITHITLAQEHTMAVTSHGRLLAWGDNVKLLLNTSSKQIVPFVYAFYNAETVRSEIFPYESNIVLFIPIDEEYIFSGWYNDTELTIPFSLSVMPMSSLTIYGKWTPKT